MMRDLNLPLLTLLMTLILLLSPIRANAENYPGVFASDNALVFVQNGNETGDLTGVVILSYEFSMDWVITTASNGYKSSDSIILTDGNQYVYRADGARQSQTEFISLEKDLDWSDFDFNVLPSYSYYLAPMVQGGLAYALIETRSGLPTQLILASEVIETPDMINLFEGFLYQVTDGELTAQIAFTETAFGSQGLIRGSFPDDFPPPPEDYPSPYPSYPTPSYPPPVDYPPVTAPPINPAGPGGDVFFPTGAEVPADQISDQPHFSFEPVYDYDVPQIQKIGLVTTRSYAEIEGWETVCDESIRMVFADRDVEIVLIPWDSSTFGGAVIWDRAVWLCEQYDVDALMISELTELEMPGYVGPTGTSRTVRINSAIRSKIIDGTAGAKIWEGDFEFSQNHDYYELDGNENGVIRGDIMRLVNAMTDDIDEKGILDGFHVD